MDFELDKKPSRGHLRRSHRWYQDRFTNDLIGTELFKKRRKKKILPLIHFILYPLRFFKRSMKFIFASIMEHLFEKRQFHKVLFTYNLLSSIKRLFYNCSFLENSLKRYKFNCLPTFFYKVDSFKNQCDLQSNKYFVVEESKERKVFVPCDFIGDNEKTISAFSPEIFIAELNSVSVIGENNIVLTEEFCLNDMVKEDLNSRTDYRYSSIKHIDSNFALIEYEKNQEAIEAGIFFIGFAPYNYFHLTIEILSKLQYIDNFNDYSYFPLLIDEIVLATPQFKCLLSILNKKNHPVIPIKKRILYNVEKLIYPSYNSWLPINLKKGMKSRTVDFLIAQSAVEYVRNTVFEHYRIEKNNIIGKRKIFISRTNTNHRRLINEKQVADFFYRNGFEIIYPEKMSFKEQVTVFSESKCIVGATGAAFTNIIYCPGNAIVVSIIPREYDFFLYSTLCKLAELDSFLILDAKITKRSTAPSGDRFFLDLKEVTTFFEKLIF